MPNSKKPTKQRSRKPARKVAPAKGPGKTAPKRTARAGKADGNAGVLAYIARLPSGQKAVAAKVDAIIARTAPRVKRALKWNVPFYGLEGQGWFCALAAFTNHSNLNFFRGVELDPVPPQGGVKENRRVVYRTVADVDEKQLASWVRQAAAIPGWLAPK